MVAEEEEEVRKQGLEPVPYTLGLVVVVAAAEEGVNKQEPVPYTLGQVEHTLVLELVPYTSLELNIRAHHKLSRASFSRFLFDLINANY